MRMTWKIGGEAGFGIMVAGQTFSRILSHAGYFINEINDYPSLIRGGHNVVSVTWSDQPLHASWQPVDILIALNKDSIDYHYQELTQGGIVIYDGDEYELDKSKYPSHINFLPVPLKKTAIQVGAGMLMRNTVALGATLAVLGLPLDYLTDILAAQFSRKGETVVKQNVDAAKVGYEYVTTNSNSKTTRKLKVIPKEDLNLVLTGAEGVGLGAIAGGVKFFVAYPMTPINPLLAFMAAKQTSCDFVYKQPEDEIAGINMAVGAGFAGVRSVVATAGGGFSLMVEGTGLAGMIESPVVIVMGMRPGPATGLPTWTAQADLHFVLNAAQGEFPRLVLAPGDPEEAFYLTAEALNLADCYQTPTFVLVDKALMETRYSIPMLQHEKITIDRGKLLTEEEQNNMPELARYEFTKDGISPRGVIGRKGGIFRGNSDEHDIHGYSNEDAGNTRKMIEKRMKKLYEAEKHVPDPVVYKDNDADITLVGWGSTKGPVLEAIHELSTHNYQLSTNYLHLNYINPFPTKFVTEFLSRAKRPIDIEGNHNGQMADWIKMKTGIELKERILKYDGRPFYPEEIIKEIKRLS